MKKLMILLLTIFLIIPVGTKASSQTVEVVNDGGYNNVQFSNGYVGFCIDMNKHESEKGGIFSIANSTNVANNNVTEEDVSQKLKLLFVLNFEDMFLPDENHGYILNSSKAATSIGGAVWTITDNRSQWGEITTFVNKVNEYSGPAIPDEGHKKTLANGDVITFYFMVVQPEKAGVQDFFAYKIDVKKAGAHEHEASTDWKDDGENHWKECECGETLLLGAHIGGEATCHTKKICTTCGKEYGTFDLENHVGETELKNYKAATLEAPGYTGDVWCKSCNTMIEEGEEIPQLHEHEASTDWKDDGENHWKECECEEKLFLGAHIGGEATCHTKKICTTCGKEYGTFDLENHVGETELKNYKAATLEAPGYTGDVWCKSCNTMIEEGEEIPQLHEHEASTDWKDDGENHWKECECGETLLLGAHIGGEATCHTKKICTTCGKEYGTFDLENHVGETELKNYKAATLEAPGYTGDVWCKSCNTMIEEGEEIPQLHEHEASTDWKDDGESHWKECECGERLFETTHNHVLDETTVKEATCTNSGYTGDKVCECGNVIKGEEIEMLPHHHTLDHTTVKKPTHTEEGYTGDEICKCGDVIKGRTISKLANTPVTGDDSDILLWSISLAISGLCIGLVIFIKKIRKV